MKFSFVIKHGGLSSCTGFLPKGKFGLICLHTICEYGNDKEAMTKHC